MKKKCFKCGDEKEIETEFHKHPMMADGHLNKCKECTRKDVTQNRRKNIDKYRQFDRDRSNLPHRIKAREDYQRKARMKNPEKDLARQTAERALKRGELIKEKCHFCNAEEVEMHHVDYFQPLKVYWICVICHRKFDKIAGEMIKKWHSIDQNF